jgi:hydroxymethylpyrimidine pyrophosphatase-like HAD family hydrolase
MFQRILAFDFDGTLAEHGSIPVALQTMLQRIHTAGYLLFLVTGRRFGQADLGVLDTLFTGIIWENGAVLAHTASGEVYLPFGSIDSRLVQELEAASIPLEHGQAIVATWMPHADAVWQVIQHWGADATLVQNKGALMILPAGATKGTGLEHMLRLCRLSPHNVAAFGDAENDLSLLELSGYAIAVADAVRNRSPWPSRSISGTDTLLDRRKAATTIAAPPAANPAWYNRYRHSHGDTRNSTDGWQSWHFWRFGEWQILGNWLTCRRYASCRVPDIAD